MEHGHLIEATMDRNVISVAGLAVEAVYVLRNEVFVCEPVVYLIGAVVSVGRKAVEIPTQEFQGVVLVHGARGHLLGRVVLAAHGPVAVGTAEGGYAAFGAYAGTGDVERIHGASLAGLLAPWPTAYLRNPWM